MQGKEAQTTVKSFNQTIPSTEKEERKMSGIRCAVIGLVLTIATIFSGNIAFAQLGGVDLATCWIREWGVGPVLNLAAAPAPLPVGLDGLARSNNHYFYTTTVAPCDTIFKINIAAGATVNKFAMPGFDFQALAFATNADSLGNPRLYGLDVTGNQLVEFDPALMVPTALVPIAPGVGVAACSGGNGRVFVQVQVGGIFRIYGYNILAGTWGPNFPTPAGGGVLFDGFSSFMGGLHVGTVLAPGGGCDVWYRLPGGGGWNHVGGAIFPSYPFMLSALGAF